MNIENLIDMLTTTGSPASEEWLVGGWIVNAKDALAHSKELVKSQVQVTTASRCIVRIKAKVSESTASIQDVNKGLKSAWAAGMAYKYFQATNCTWYKEAMVLRFATMLSDDAPYITGSIVVDGARYASLASLYEAASDKWLPSH